MFFPCKAVSEYIICRYEYILLKAGIKLLTTATVLAGSSYGRAHSTQGAFILYGYLLKVGQDSIIGIAGWSSD